MAGILNDVFFALNADYTGGGSLLASENNGLISNGQMWIGSTVRNAGGTHINVGRITSPTGTVLIGYSSPNITIDVSGSSVTETITGDTGGALSPTAGNFNIFGGANAGQSVKFNGSGSTLSLNIADGSDNIFLGRVSGKVGNTATDNVGVGSGTFQNITNAQNNTAVGFSALNGVTSGSFNVAVGFQSASGITTANSTTAVGYQSLAGGTGLGNTSIGYQSLLSLATGATNLVIGYTAGTSYVGAESNNILIGHVGVAAESNVMRLGTSGSGTLQVNKCFVAAITGVTVANSALTTCDANGQLGTLASGSSGQILRSNGSASPSFSTATYPATAGTAGNVLTSDGTNWTSAAPGAYSLQAGAGTQFAAPADATTYYFSPFCWTAASVLLTTISNSSRIYIPKSGTIVAVYGNLTVAGTLASNENITLAIRLNDTSNTNVTTTLQGTATANPFSNNALSLAVTAGDFISVMFITPTWATNPTNISLSLTIFVQ